MESYRTDDEQIEALKNWWNENGKSTVIGIAVALALVFGWQGWQTQRENRIAEASATYQDLLEADRAVESDRSRLSTAKHLAQTLRTEYAGTTYAIFGAMYQAKYAAAADDWAGAEQALNWVIEQGPEEPLLLQAKVRLAYVLLEQKRYAEAQQVLAGSELGSYAALIAETLGDIALAQGKEAEALAAYREAQQELAALENASSNPLLEMKIRDLLPADSVEPVERAAEQSADNTQASGAGSE